MALVTSMEGLVNFQSDHAPWLRITDLEDLLTYRLLDLNPQSSNSHHLIACVSDSLLLRADHSGVHHNAIFSTSWSHSTLYGGWETKQETEQPHLSGRPRTLLWVAWSSDVTYIY